MQVMNTNCPLCGSIESKLLAKITKKPTIEIDYKIPEELYNRKIYQCRHCDVYFNQHALIDFTSFYTGHYNNSIDPLQSLDSRFKRIINIPFDKSDNKQRVSRVIDRTKIHMPDSYTPTVLDVGSGTCVFLYEVLEKWNVNAFCVDPDPTSIAHVNRNIPKVTTTTGTISDIDRSLKFNLITFNKVLEHVPNPIEQLSIAREYLDKNGIVYVELPYGDQIADEKSFSENSEFNVEHITIYNQNSIDFLARHAGFDPIETAHIKDPSGKHTIYSFLKVK